MIVVDLIRNSSGDLYAKLSYNPQKNYLLMKWMGPCSDDEVKAASLKMLEWQKREGISKKCLIHVHDTKEIEGAWAGLVDWITNYFFPLNYDHGLRYNLSIISPDMFSKLSSIQLEQNGGKVPTVICETLSEAERWISNKYAQLH